MKHTMVKALLFALLMLSIFLVGCEREWSEDVRIVSHDMPGCTVLGMVKNFSDGTAHDVKVYARFTDRNGDYAGSKLSYSIGQLRPGESASFRISVPPKQCAPVVWYDVWPEWLE